MHFCNSVGSLGKNTFFSSIFFIFYIFKSLFHCYSITIVLIFPSCIPLPIPPSWYLLGRKLYLKILRPNDSLIQRKNVGLFLFFKRRKLLFDELPVTLCSSLQSPVTTDLHQSFADNSAFSVCSLAWVEMSGSLV